MQLKRFRVEQFRSVQDSGWIECSNVTTLVGINESGKSNLLLALWKLNPARAGQIDVLHDMPVTQLSTLRTKTAETNFITAEFILDETSANNITEKTNQKFSAGDLVVLRRFYNGEYKIDVPNKIFTNDDSNESGNQVENVAESSVDSLKKAILEEIPKFVYYSNYGNLTSRIYLPHVIKWLKGETVNGFDVKEDHVRTLRVLFDFVNLKPEEILELGKDPKVSAMERNYNHNSVPNEEEVKQAEESKEKRSILLQSAASKLTRSFKEWWKQGEYKFRFEADGDYFTIWVSDNVRTEEVALELRSTGLQWFLSFYLIFLVESKGQYKDTILLLDEAGLTLHPLAQRDLRKFFDNLAITNQIVNTTHSPFIVDTNSIDNCRVVYTDANGYTKASDNLRDGAGINGNKSIYAVHAALGLSVSDILFQGCTPVIVEGITDQYYLNAIKNYLISEKKCNSRNEIVFIPSGGVRGIQGVVSLLAGKNDVLPLVVLDSDKSGQDYKRKLEDGLYKSSKQSLIEIKDYIELDNSEIEDLVPFKLLEKGIDKLFRDVEDEEFSDVYDEAKPIVPQIENFAKKYAIQLPPGWKVEMARVFKQRMLSPKLKAIDEKYTDAWENLFKTITSNLNEE